jgi:ATPase
MLEQEVQSLIDILFQEVINRSDSFLEIDRKLSKVLQIGHYRVVIVLPPLSDGLELTIVKPIKRLSIADYHLDPKIIDLLQHKSQ